MVTYSGKVGMCCHDWGARHTIGYLDKSAFSEEKDIEDVNKKIKKNKKGFELLREAKIPESFNKPSQTVSNLKEIWLGEELNKVRELHEKDQLNSVNICKNCTFKDTYHWEKIKI